MERRILVYSNANGTKEIIENSSMTTWGELKAHLEGKGLWGDGYEAIVKGPRTNLKLNDALLPDTEFTLFVVPGKMKSGGEMTKEEAKERISEIMDKAKAKIIKLIDKNAGVDFFSGLDEEFNEISKELRG